MDVSSCGAHYNISLSGDLSVPHWAEAGQCGLGWLMTDRQWKCQDLRPLQSWSSRPASNQLISDDKQSARESHNNMKVTGRVFPSEEEGISKQQQADTLLLSSKVSTGETGEGFIYIYWKSYHLWRRIATSAIQFNSVTSCDKVAKAYSFSFGFLYLIFQWTMWGGQYSILIL